MNENVDENTNKNEEKNLIEEKNLNNLNLNEDKVEKDAEIFIDSKPENQINNNEILTKEMKESVLEHDVNEQTIAFDNKTQNENNTDINNRNSVDDKNSEDIQKSNENYINNRSLSKKQSLQLQIDEISAQKIIEKNLESIQRKMDFDPNLYNEDRRINTHVPTFHVKNININNTTYISNNQEVRKDIEIKIDEEIVSNNKAKEKDKKKNKEEQNKVNTSVTNQSVKNLKNKLVDYQRYMFKIILLGNIAVGKTCLLSYFVDNVFRTEYTCTVGVDFKVKTVSIEPDKKIDLQIWDTSGEERFKTITKQYYRDASGILIIFDVTNEKSFYDVTNWIEDIKNYSKLNVSIILVGNKCDLENQRVISKETALEFANKNDLKYYETSAKTGTKVASMFEELALIMVNKFDLEEAVKKQSLDEDEKSNAIKNTAFVVDDKSSKSRKKKKNCC